MTTWATASTATDAAREGRCAGVVAQSTNDTAHLPRPGHVLMMFQPRVGGVPRYVMTLVDGLIRRGWTVTAAAPSTTSVYEELARTTARVIPLDTPTGLSPRSDARVVRELATVCRHGDVDIVHAHSSKAGALAVAVGALSDTPSVYTPHAWSFQRELSAPGRQAYISIERQLMRAHRRVIAVAESEQVEALRLGVVKPAQIEWVPTGLRDEVIPDAGTARARLQIDRDVFTVAWVGRPDPQKRPEHLLALARALEGFAKLAVLGYKMDETDIGRSLRRDGNTILSTESPSTLYAAADVLAVTSRWEASPLVVIEAMRAGIPVVAYDVGGISAQVLDGRTGFMVPPGDVTAMADRLKQLAGDPGLARSMGDRGRERFVAKFSSDRMVDRIAAAYHPVISASR